MDFGEILGLFGNAMQQGGSDDGRVGFNFSGMQQQKPVDAFSLLRGEEEGQEQPRSLLDLLTRYDSNLLDRLAPNNSDTNANWLSRFGGY